VSALCPRCSAALAISTTLHHSAAKQRTMHHATTQHPNQKQKPKSAEMQHGPRDARRHTWISLRSLTCALTGSLPPVVDTEMNDYDSNERPYHYLCERDAFGVGRIRAFQGCNRGIRGVPRRPYKCVRCVLCDSECRSKKVCIVGV
jgi:hypothetical protein